MTTEEAQQILDRIKQFWMEQQQANAQANAQTRGGAADKYQAARLLVYRLQARKQMERRRRQRRVV